jgi:7-keto-8-aminopelargonate synthetase-like enzyme
LATVEEILQAVDDVVTDGVQRGVLHNIAEDTRLDGRLITVNGKKLINFGSCSYLGLETHPALKAAAVDAAQRYGTQFSSSRAYISAPDYAKVEELFSTLFGRPTVVTPSTTMGHIAAIPTLVSGRDALLMDHQVHHSVQTAAKLAQSQGSTVELVPHLNMNVLDRRVAEYGRTHRRVWYAADGLFSMYADFVPVDVLNELVERHEQLWLYLDDAHSVSWTGRFGRGHVLERLSPEALSRSVVCGSLNKSFAAAGGALTFPDAETRRRVFSVGGPLIFSGPVQPPMLGALRASAQLHMTDEVARRQARLLELIRLFNRLASEEGLPLVSHSEAPIRCIGAGVPRVAYNLAGRLRAEGYFADTASFPAVPAKLSGARVTLTAHHSEDDVAALVETLATALPAALAEEGSSVEVLERSFSRQLQGRPVRMRPVAPVASPARLRLEHHVSIDSIDRDEWDTLFAGRGAFDWHGLRTLEDAFAGEREEPEHSWGFDYWIVRDPARGGAPVAATFFTTALWKDDLFSSPELSAEVEARRAEDPYYLTSRMVGMGSLLTEGDHLYLDRTADWRAALRLILDAARAVEDTAEAAAVVLRDLGPDSDMHRFLTGEGFVRLPAPTAWTRVLDFVDDDQFLAGLKKKHRYHQRTQVLAWEDRYKVDVIPSGPDMRHRLTREDLDHLYGLYRNVHARSLFLNVFPLPRRLFDSILPRPGWELTTLRLIEGPERPVAFAMQHVGTEHVQPVFVGLDYAFVASHRAYQQTLWQSIRSGRRAGVPRVLMGVSADLHKARFGAVPEERWVYVQPSETFHTDVLSRLAQGLSLAG